VPIAPTSFGEWYRLEITPGSLGAPGDLVAEVRSADGATVLIPAQPVTAPIDLTALNAPLVPALRVQVYFTKSGAVAPTVDNLRVTWRPVSQVFIDKQGPAEVQAGDNIVYRVRYAVNYVRAQNLVVWDRLPQHPDSLQYPVELSPTPYPGQDDSPAFVSATKGGQYHPGPGPLLVSGVSVPANSVYWSFASVDEGVTDLLTFTVATRHGTLDGTRVTNRAFASAANATSVESPIVVTAIRSVPSPFLDKQQGAAIFNINGALQTRAGTVNGFTISAQNRSGLGRETMYNAVVYDDLSSLANVIEDLGTPGLSAEDVFNISPAGGAFIPNYDPDGPGGAAPIPAIVWNIGALTPGATFYGSFSAQLQVNPPQTRYVNKACLTSDQTSPLCDQIDVQIGLDETPTGSFAKGDNASGTFSIRAATDDNAASAVPYGGSVGYALFAVNNSVVKLNDLLLLDQVPDHTTFNSAWFNDPNLAQSGAKIFYSTSALFPDQDNPPPVDHTQAPADLDAALNSYWERYDLVPPANPADVKWVAFYIPQLDSVHLPNEGTPALPGTPITSAAGYFDVNVFSPANQCTDTLLTNRGIFRVYERTDLSGVTAPISGGPLSATDDEQVAVKGYIGRLLVAGQSSLTPNPVLLPTAHATYSVTIQNSAAPTSDALANVQVVLQLSQVAVNGVMQFPSVQAIAPAGSYDAANGSITILLGQMLPGASRAITLQLGLPAGILNGETYCVTLTGVGYDNQCGSSTISDSACGVVQSSPTLSVRKSAAADLIPTGAEYDYELQYQNLGTGPSTATFIVDRVPARTVFVRASGNPNITRVWFSAANNLPPQVLNPFAPITAATIASQFTPGTPSGNDWSSPFGAQTYWLAFEVDDPALNPPQFGINAPRTVGFTVRNDDDGQGPGTAGSPEGTLLFNSAAIFSDELLQAIGNQVITRIDSSPSILVDKTGPAVVEAGVPFQWVIQYRNDTLLNPDDTVTIADTLPAGITFISATHQWNAAAVANGAPGGASVQNVSPTVVNNVDGTTTLTFPIAGATGYRGANVTLAGLEGGTITLLVNSDPATPSGSVRINNVCGTAETDGDVDTSCDEHQVTIFRPDLELLKYASPANVLAGGNVTYQLVVANRGPINARDVVLADALPAGVNYVPGSLSVLTPGYTIGAPNISGQTLTWSVANGNAITRTGLPAGEIPGASGNILIQFNVQVGADVPGCTTLENCAQVATASAEEGVYANVACASVTVPPPDLAVAKSGPSLARPGNRVSWTVTWLNQSLQAAAGVYVIDSLPANVTFVSVQPPSGVTAYFHAAPVNAAPAFDVSNPASGGWSATPTAPVNHIALLAGAVAGNAGPFNAQVTVDLIDPVTHALPAPGTPFTNSVVIAQLDPLCEDTSNNRATAIVRTPSLDLALTKTGSVEGSLPGLAPGQPIAYTIAFENSGTVNAYGVRINDTLPATLVAGNPLDNFSDVSLADASGNPVSPVDPSGAPISGAVPVTRTISGNVVTWYLGTTTPTDALYYQKVGLPPGSKGAFELRATIAESVADNTQVCNAAMVSADVGVEELLANNRGESCVIARRADVAVRKSGMELPSGDPIFAEAGSLIQYRISYNNLGSISAQNVVIDEIVPDGTRLVNVNAPAGAMVSYAPSELDATGFSVQFDALTAPANAVRSAVGSAGADLLPPTLDSVSADCGSNVLTLAFSERMDFDSAMRLANYRVTPGVGLQGLELSADGRTLFLFTSPLSRSNNYTLTVSNVADVAGNVMAASAVVPFRCPTAPVIVAQPMDLFVEENHTATFTVVATGATPLFYQWQKNGDDIPGETNATLAVPASLTDDNSAYRVLVANALGSVWSASATLYVMVDITPPTLVGLDAPVNGGVVQITLWWSEVVNEGSATEPSNYLLGPSANTAAVIPISSVTYLGSNVVLTLPWSLMANTPYTLVVQFQTDLVGNMAETVTREFLSGAPNCCGSCTEGNALTVTNVVYPGWNFLAAPRCGLWSNYLVSTILPVVPEGTTLIKWIPTEQQFGQAINYLSGTWYDMDFNPDTATLSPGEGLILQNNSGAPFTIEWTVCEQRCLQACGSLYTPNWSLVGGRSLLASTYTELVGCPPVCGTAVGVFDPIAQSFALHTFGNGVWTPREPVIPAGAAAFVYDPMAGGSGQLDTIPGIWLFGIPSHESWFDHSTNCISAPISGDCLAVDTNGVYEAIALANPDRFIGWKRLFVEQTIPDGASIIYSIGRLASGAPVFDLGPLYTSVSVGLDGLDLSGINPAYTNLVLRAEHLGDGTNQPCLKSWLMTYDSREWPSFTFTVRVDDEPCGGPLPIHNVVSISTTTPEIDLANNTASYTMNVRLTELQVAMRVDKSAALIGETLTYTLDYAVLGPQAAPATYLQVVLADGDGNGSADVTLNPFSGVPAYYHTASTLTPPLFDPLAPNANGWTTSRGGANHAVFLLGDLAPNSSGSFAFGATIKPGTAGRTLVSTLSGHTARRETECDNTGSALTYVGNLANVFVEKSGPGCVHPGEVVSFTIRYGNNGNLAAENVVVSDEMPAGLVFVSATPAPSGPGLAWNNLGAMPGALAVNESGVITVLARIENDYTLVGGSLENVATIATTTPEVNIADNRDSAVIDCITAEAASLSGHVYHDRDNDGVREPAAGESGIAGVTVALTGTDVFGQAVALATVTDQSGEYSFIGLTPGSYTLTETQPSGWSSVSDTIGFVGGVPTGNNANQLDNVLGAIQLNGGEAGLEYNFGENCTEPLAIQCAPPLNLTCAAEVPAPNPAAISASASCAACGPVTVAWAGDVMTASNGVSRFTIARTYRATDRCGNTATCEQLITVNDATPPVITCPPSEPVCQWRLFCGYTQGGWGAAPSGNNPAMILQNNFAFVYRSGFVEIGIPGSAGFSAKFTSAAAIEAYLPCGKSAKAFTADTTNPSASAGNVFAGQVLALQLNVDFSDAGVTGGSVGFFGDLVLNDPSSPLHGKTVRQILAIANTALGGGNVSSYGVTIGSLNVLADALNRAFDNCEVSAWANSFIVMPPAPEPASAATATDNCDANPAIAYSDIVTNGPVSGSYLITRTWTATDASGNSASCSQMLVYAGRPPKKLAATPASLAVALQWNPSAGATSYTVQRATAGSVYAAIASGITGTNFTDTSVVNGTIYYYRVSAVKGALETCPSEAIVAIPAAPLPSPWASKDIGSVAATGGVSHVSGTFTVIGSGADIAGTEDEFRFAYQLAGGDCTVVARVASVANTHPSAKAGVMIRESLNVNARHASVFVTPANGAEFSYRLASGNSTAQVASAGPSAPLWLKVTRVGNTFTAHHSADGVTWTALGSQSVTMGAAVYIGLGVTSHNDGVLCPAVFDNVTVTP